MVEYVIASLQSFRISRATVRDRGIFYKRQEQAWDSDTTIPWPVSPRPVLTGAGGQNRYLQDIMPRTRIG
jgi:hypothetical protein